jgi:hypothetical protein
MQDHHTYRKLLTTLNIGLIISLGTKPGLGGCSKAGDSVNDLAAKSNGLSEPLGSALDGFWDIGGDCEMKRREGGPLLPSLGCAIHEGGGDSDGDTECNRRGGEEAPADDGEDGSIDA